MFFPTSTTMKRSIFVHLKLRKRLSCPNEKHVTSSSVLNTRRAHYSCSLFKPTYFPLHLPSQWYVISHINHLQNSSSNKYCEQIMQHLESIASVNDLDQKRSILEDCKLTSFNDDDILLLFQKVSQLHHRKEFKNHDCIRNLINLIDSECQNRASSWNTATFIDFLKQYSPYCTTDSKFMFYAVNRRTKAVFRNPLSTILEYIQIMNDTESWRKFKGNKYELEYILRENFDKLNLQEIELLLEPLVVLKSCLMSDKLKKKLCIKLISEFDAVTNSLLKKFLLIFYNQTFYCRNFLFITPWLLRIFQKFHERIDDFDFECLNHAALLCTRMFIYDSHILERIAAILLEKHFEIRLEEIENAVYVLTYFDFQLDTKNLYIELGEIMQESLLKSSVSNPKIFLRLLYHFSNVGVYSYDLLKVVFSDNFLTKLYGPKLKGQRISSEMHALVGGVILECPDYKSNIPDRKLFRYRNIIRKSELPKELKEHPFIENVNSNSMSPCLNASRKISPYNRVLYCTRGILDDMFGNADCTHICYLLSHFKKANILFCLDDRKNPQKIPESIRQTFLVDRSMLNPMLNWYVVAFISQNSYTNTPPQPMGHEIPKIRQFKLLGCKVVTITRHGWLKMCIEEKKKIIKEKIFADSVNSLAMFDKFN